MQIDAPYHHVYHALTIAFALENVPILKISSALRDLRAEGLARPPSYYQTPWDRHAQAAIVLDLITRYCNAPEIIQCRYQIVRTPEDMRIKLAAALYIARESQYDFNIFTLLCVAQWGGMKIAPEYMRECSQLLGRSIRMLWYRRNKIYAELDGKLDRAVRQLDPIMYEMGLIQENA